MFKVYMYCSYSKKKLSDTKIEKQENNDKNQ